jgi:hypothetical protein
MFSALVDSSIMLAASLSLRYSFRIVNYTALDQVTSATALLPRYPYPALVFGPDLPNIVRLRVSHFWISHLTSSS